jgi:hypothetical protein
MANACDKDLFGRSLRLDSQIREDGSKVASGLMGAFF